MKRNINNVFVVAQKEFADNLWSPRFWILLSIFLLILFSYSYRTGLGSSFIDVIQIIAVFAPIIGIALGFDAVTKETESNSLNVLLTHPVFRDNIITGKILGSMSTLLLVIFLSVSVLFGTNLLISGKQASLLELNRFLIFAILQKYNRLNLLVPVNAKHMWNAAMESKSCKLTALGEHYRKLVSKNRI